MVKQLALAALLCAPAVAHCQQPLPPIPDSVPSAFGWVQVKKVVGLSCTMSDDRHVAAYGCWIASQRLIVIRDSVPLVTQWISLEHERTHARFFDAGYRLPVDSTNKALDDLEDAIARALAAQRVAEIRLTGKP